jgi:predicted glycoside hydrolase/deacetylase ChbG (UPF0249 family)
MKGNDKDRLTLAERLGYASDDRLLIINCDDLGSSHSANVAAFRSLTYGVATSATLMIPCPWAREAARMCQQFAVGVHLTLTCEYAGYRWRGLTVGASLLDDEGFFPTTTGAVAARVTEADARAECRAQIETALAWGLNVTHIDTHMSAMQARADLWAVYLDLAREFRLPVRMPPRDDTRTQRFNARERAEARGVLFNDHFFSPWPRRTRDVYFEEVPKLAPGVTETFGHPVLDGEELRGYDTENADIRVHDAACLTDPTVAELLKRHDVKPISYREIREVQRAAMAG